MATVTNFRFSFKMNEKKNGYVSWGNTNPETVAILLDEFGTGDFETNNQEKFLCLNP